MRLLRFPRGLFHALLVVALGTDSSGSAMAAQNQGLAASARAPFERCLGIQDERAPLRCLTDATADKIPQEQSRQSGPWRLLRTPNPTGGRDAVSIMRIAEIPDSDLEFAGLMLRCNDISIEVLVVLVRPLAPLSHPTVEFETESKRVQFTANVVTPGALLLLPPEAAALAAGPWQESPKLFITVEDESGPISGVVSLTGLTNALQVLQANCQIR
jgi:hypothetical protein